MGKTNDADSFARNHIAKGTSISGDIETNGDIRIDGVLVGTLKSTGKVVVGSTGSIDGDIICQNSNVSGKVKGKITVKEFCRYMGLEVADVVEELNEFYSKKR